MNDNQNQTFDFNLEDHIETENQVLAWLLKQFLKWFALLLSALTTGAFFFTYAGDAFNFILGDASPHVTALIGALSLDGLSQVWAYLRGHQATTIRQMTTARVMSWTTLLLSVLVTIIYLALTAALDIGVTASDGTLTNLGRSLNLAGVIIIIAAIAGNFAAYHYYNDSDIKNQQAVQRNTINAKINQASYIIDTERLNRTINETTRGIIGELPAHTRRAGRQNKENYIESHFGKSKRPPIPKSILNGRRVSETSHPPGPEESDPTPPQQP